MPRRSLAFLVPLGILIGCQDRTTPTALPDDPAPAAINLKPLQDLLSDPLVQELVGTLSNRAVAGSFNDLRAILEGPSTDTQLPLLYQALAQVRGDLTPTNDDGPDDVVRALLGLVVEEADVVLTGLDPVQEKGT